LFESGAAFSEDIVFAGAIIRTIWPPLRPRLAPLLVFKCRLMEWRMNSVLTIEIATRLADYDTCGAATLAGDVKSLAALPSVRNDFLQWCIDQAKADGDPALSRPSVLVAHILTLNFAVGHNISLALTNALYDAAATSAENLIELREDVMTQLEAFGDDPRGPDSQKGFNKVALAKMEKLDSFLRESQRLSNANIYVLNRFVTNPDGITTPLSHLHLPEGTHIAVNNYSILHDNANYGPDAEGFKPFRFVDPHLGHGQAQAKGSRKTFTTTSPEYLVFGHGKYACPGRFTGATTLKICFGLAILNYEFDSLTSRPPLTWAGLFILPPLNGTMRIRRRKKTGLPSQLN
jgi:cytochrome P450